MNASAYSEDRMRQADTGECPARKRGDWNLPANEG